MLAFMILDFEIGAFRNEATSYNTSKMISITYTATYGGANIYIYMIRIDGEKKKNSTRETLPMFNSWLWVLLSMIVRTIIIIIRFELRFIRL